MLRPFWRYYGSKWRAAPRYPKPRHRTIIEPFAGAAGYSLRYPDHDVILVEKYPVIAAIWRWLIAVDAKEVLAIPDVDAVADLPEWVPQSARWLVGMTFLHSATRPRNSRASGLSGRSGCDSGWSRQMRERIAAQVAAIRHWRVIEGDYTAAPNVEATWFIDSPYKGKSGRRYVHTSSKLDYGALATWCRSRRGQVTVCEAAGATWLPFAPFGSTNSMGSKRSGEAIWWSDSSRKQELLPLEAA